MLKEFLTANFLEVSLSKMKIGIQLYSLRKYLKTENQVAAVFDRVKKMGAEVVQVSGMCEISSNKLAKISKDNNLPICITHSPFNRIVNDLDRLSEEHLDYSCKSIGIGSMPNEYRNSKEGIFAFIDILNKTSLELEKYGMTIAYHNHHFEFKKYDEVTMFDLLIDNTRKEVEFIPDTFWLKVGGVEPEEYIKKLAGRIKTLHLKDYQKILGFPVFRRIGKGDFDFKNILKVAEESGVENAVVELDFSPRPYISMEKSIQYLKSIY